MRKIVILITAFLLSVVLVGCSTYTVEEAKETPYSVIELTGGGLGSERTFAYINEEGVQKPLPNCGKDSLFSKRHCKTDDGSVVFLYSTRKGNLRRATITADNKTHNLNCDPNEEKALSGLEICIPTN